MQVFPGQFYRHFKGHVYMVTEIATDTETMRKVVIYKDIYSHDVWARPLSSFIDILDEEKYPGHGGEHRFELILGRAPASTED